MVRAKSTTLTIHIEPGLKEGLRAAADREHRSIANMIEGLIRGYCGRNGVPEPPKRFHRKLASWQSRNFDGTVVELPSPSVFPGYTVEKLRRRWITIHVSGLPERQLTLLASTPYRDPAGGHHDCPSLQG